MTKENAIDFLLYSILGVTVGDVCFDENCPEDTKDHDDDRVKAAIIRAYSDATMEGAYNTLFKGKEETLRKKSESAKRKGGELILNEIKKFFRDGSSSNDNYDGWHDKLCKGLEEEYKNVTDGKTKFFTYGNAQKWVNMTIKYLCLIDALSDGFIYHKRLCKFQSKFHIPVDSYIIKAVWNQPDVDIPLKEDIYQNITKDRKTCEERKDAIDGFRDNKKNYNPQNYVKAWSTWDGGKESEYNRFQKKIRGIAGSSPLDWENETWIKQAEKRKLKEKSSIRSKYKYFFKEDAEASKK